ncbi:ATP-grasp domain-containing protein [Sphaerotilus mobilis]|uniref:Putative ATP-grasp superfamily ATP-dependent carboligase n=1 Tax=Sphaerotilus mobilis TaxID=47994 RepID=A0A4Q7LFU6_9BURK|nr:ATP-grasp domain-containing protein [Sphaerotilus mobilis]RZS52198.1 putative ATP-grasp superfamily ATP-dependent carboligase [Sphaerotilus mobilis]
MSRRAARILVHEHVTAGGLHGWAPAATEAELWPMGAAMREAVAADLLALPADRVAAVTVIDARADATEPDGPARRQTVRPRAGESALDALARLARSHDHVWAIAPETDGLMQACLERVGPARWLGSDARTLRLSASKTRTLAALAEAGARTPFDPALARSVSHWVVKPDDGAGATDTRRHKDLVAAQADAAGRSGPVTLQPWIDGEPLSLTLLGHAEQLEALSLNRQHIVVDDAGEVRFDGVTAVARPGDGDARWPALLALVEQLHRAAPGLRGLVGLDLVWHPQAGPVAIELNARTSCAYIGLSHWLGRSLADEVLGLRMGQSTENTHG